MRVPATCHPERPTEGRGLCSACYQRARSRGGVLPPAKVKSPPELLAEARKGRSDEDCWPWPGNISPTTGYGRVRISGELHHAFRWAYEALVGPIGAGLVPDHLCHTNDVGCSGGPTCPHRACVNPGHMELVTQGENSRRGNARRTRARCGHPYTPENTYLRKHSSGYVYRACRTCVIASNRKSRKRT